MKLLFEEYSYPIECLQNLVSSHFYVPNKEGTEAKMNYVGYFFNNNPDNPKEADAVFILPKVFLNEKSEPFELDGLKPEDIINLDDRTNKLLRDQGISNMVSELAIWLYQAIQFYHERKTDSSNKEQAAIRDVVSNRGQETITYLDTILQLRRFYKEHKQLLTFVSIINNFGNNKIQWSKTISHETPIVRDNRPAYVNFRTKGKVINFDEEIIVLFYSVLDYLKHRFHFQVNINIQYTLLSHKRIEGMIESRKGTRYLKKIRKKYFTDEFVALWKLLYAYFDKAERIASRCYHDETLLVRYFNPVFEDMIDYLISDDDYPEELKIQNNGSKIVDHLYEEKSLIYDEHIYFVGDSKYYNTHREEMDEHSITKQYFYAKNIIQRNIDVICGFDQDFGKKKAKNPERYFHYRDELTKGYNITPNFFISGIARRNKQSKQYEKSEAQLENITGKALIYNRHFINRLFDRDTLVLQHYNINFLYVLTAYAAQQQSARDHFKRLARRDFRKHIVAALSENYNIYQICLPKEEDMQLFVKRNYYQLAGQIFSFDGILLYGEEMATAAEIHFEEQESKVKLQGDKMILELEGEKVQLKPVAIGEQIMKEYAQGLINDREDPEMEEEHVAEIIDIKDSPLFARWITNEQKYSTHIPLYNIRAACGKFLEAENDANIEGWIDTDAAGLYKHGDEYFVVQACGESMLPKIQDGAYCVFRAGGSVHRGDIVIAGIHDYDEDYYGRFTIKEFWQEFVTNENGVRERKSVTLKPLNDNGNYPTYELDGESGDGFGVFGVLVDIIEL